MPSLPLSLSAVLPGVFCWQSQDSDPQGPVNSYLWHGPRGVVAIDPAADVPAEFGEASQFVVTHVQNEHIAGAAHWPSTPLFVSAKDAYLCDGAAAYAASVKPWQEPWDWSQRGNFQGHLAGARNERPPLETLDVTGTLHEGDEIAGLAVIETPGQGKGALTFWAEIGGQKVAFCGDLICGDGQLWNWYDAEWDYGPYGGQKALLASARKLLALRPDVLLPAHGEPIYDACAALQRLIERMEKLSMEAEDGAPINFPDNENPAPGWRQLSPHLFQWKDGNCALLTSRDGVALLVDDGLCHWAPFAERAAHHHAVFAELKEVLGLTRIEAVAVTHYHGDHIYTIPYLLEEEPQARVATLDMVAEVMRRPAAFNLAAQLPWYGAQHDTVPVHCVFEAGEVWRWHEYELEWFHLGGQTFRHAGIMAQIDGARVAFVGDALYGWNTKCESVVCYNDAEPSRRGPAYSMERMIEQSPDLLVCGHGSALRDPMPLLLQKRAAWQRQLAAFDALNAHQGQSVQHDRDAFFNPFR